MIYLIKFQCRLVKENQNTDDTDVTDEHGFFKL